MTEQELRELWAKLAGAVGDKDEDGKFTLATVARTMKENAHALFQHVFNVGHSERNKKATNDEKALRDQLTAKEEEATRLQSELETAKAGQPDAAKRVTELEGQIRTLQQQHADTPKELPGQVAEAKRTARLETLRGKLAAHLDPDYAEVLVQKAEVRDRVRLNDDGSFDVLQAVGGIPFAPAEGADPMDLLVGELVETTRRTKPTLVTSGAEAGSGTGSTGGQAAERKGGDAKFFDGIREKAKEEQKRTTPDGGTGAQRMGLRQVGHTQ